MMRSLKIYPELSLELPLVQILLLLEYKIGCRYDDSDVKKATLVVGIWATGDRKYRL